MLLAYRRGLLKPYYKHGITSRLRENLLLIALGRETEAEDLYNGMMYESITLAPNIDPKKLVGYLSKKKDILEYLADFSKGSPKAYKKSSEALISSTAGLQKAFQILKERGIIDKIKRRNARWAKEQEL